MDSNKLLIKEYSFQQRGVSNHMINTRCLIKKLGILGYCFLISFVYAESVSPFQKPSSLLVAPNFILHDLQDKENRLHDYVGKKVILHFWATWCESCRKELPLLQTIWEKFKHQGLIVITIAEDSQAAVTAFMQRTPIHLPVLIDQYGNAMRTYKIKGLPTSYLIGETQEIEGIAIGAIAWEDASILNWLETLF